MKVFRAISATTAADVVGRRLSFSHLLQMHHVLWVRKYAATHTHKCTFTFTRSARWAMIHFVSLSLLALPCILVFSRSLAGPRAWFNCVCGFLKVACSFSRFKYT